MRGRLVLHFPVAREPLEEGFHLFGGLQVVGALRYIRAPAIDLGRFGGPSSGLEGVSELAIGGSVVGITPDRVLESGDGFDGDAPVHELAAEQELGRRVAGLIPRELAQNFEAVTWVWQVAPSGLNDKPSIAHWKEL